MAFERLVGGIDELDAVAAHMGLSYGESDGPFAPGVPDRAFLINLVAKAVAEYLRYRESTNPKSKMLHRRAELWLFTTYNGGGSPPSSFEWCCDLLDEDPQACRSRILGMTVEQLPKVDHFSGRRQRHSPARGE